MLPLFAAMEQSQSLKNKKAEQIAFSRINQELDKWQLQSFLRNRTHSGKFRSYALFALAVSVDVGRNAEVFLEGLADESEDVREASCYGFGFHQVRWALGLLTAALRDESPGVREQAACALGNLGDRLAAWGLESFALHDPVESVRDGAKRAMQRIGADTGNVEKLADNFKKLEQELESLSLHSSSDAVRESTRRALAILRIGAEDCGDRIKGHNVARAGLAFPRLQCPCCDRVYEIGVDASLITNEVLKTLSAANFSFADGLPLTQTSLARPALVGTIQRGDQEHQKNLREVSAVVASSIRQSLSAGRKEYWYCGACNQSGPLEFPGSWVNSED